MLQTKMKKTKKIQKPFFITLTAIFSILLVSCSEESGQQEISQIIETQAKVEVEAEKKVIEVQNTSTVISAKPQTKNTAQEDNLIDKKQEPESSIVKKSSKEELSQLQENLTNNNQQNLVLQQQKEALLKKIKENQNALEQFEQTK